MSYNNSRRLGGRSNTYVYIDKAQVNLLDEEKYLTEQAWRSSRSRTRIFDI